MMSDQRYLYKFLGTSALFLFLGTIHGVVQVLPPVRRWLDSVGSPVTGPGHMIDPLAHAHINIVGGLVMIGMAMTYYLLENISSRPIYSRRLANHSFGWLTAGVCAFYSTLLFFGIWEGRLLLADDGNGVVAAQHIYGPTIAIAATIMGMGFWIFFINVYMTLRAIRRQHDT